ncbi:MAG: hypothetical protein KAT04_15345 [Methylococcales bacterium]|nr:hypothetical protein [Methylococcales bacterium]
MDLFSELSKLVSVGLISGLISSFLAYRSHRQKKWWELKVSSYQELIEALSDLSQYYSSHYQENLMKNDLSDDYKETLSNMWDEGHRNVRRAADKGAFIFSDEVEMALKKYIKCDDVRQDDYYDHIELHEKEVKTCLSSIVTASRVDLEIKWWWL